MPIPTTPLTQAALVVIDRLEALLMTLANAAHAAVVGAAPTLLRADAAATLLTRLAAVVMTLIRLNNQGLRPAKQEAAAAQPERDPPPQAERAGSLFLPRQPGWLLEALPDAAPPIAADLRDLLDDPTTLTLLQASPTLQRQLRPLLRSLAIDLPFDVDLDRALERALEPVAPPPAPPRTNPVPTPQSRRRTETNRPLPTAKPATTRARR